LVGLESLGVLNQFHYSLEAANNSMVKTKQRFIVKKKADSLLSRSNSSIKSNNSV